ncbi:SAICAR synthase-like protein [Infundibulicybe gibba]|nr:SAICAR synthase-like protein [Infundibulicybe gibba]
MTESLLPTAQPFLSLASQVGGHADRVFTTEDNSLIIKTSVWNELNFYQMVNQNPALGALRPFMPKFLGTLKLEGQINGESNNLGEGVSVTPIPGQQEFLVLENLSHSFSKPNILDVKLGTVLYDDYSLPERVARKKKAAKNCTTGETGVRLTGFQVYDNMTSKPVLTPKNYGRRLKASELPDGMARFFPCSQPSDPPGPSAATSLNTGLPLHLLLPILQAMREDVAEIRETVAGIEMRMVGASLLITYEADFTRAEEGIKQFGLDEDEEESDDEEDDDDDDDKRPGPPYVVKLIDFAHTYFTPGRGADQSALTGIDTVIRLLDGRIKQLELIAS